MKRLVVGLLMCCAPLASFAGDEVGHWYLEPYVGGMTPDADWETRRGAQLDYGFAIGNNLSEAWSAELNLNGARPGNLYGSGHLGLYSASLDVLRVWNRSGRFAPYLEAGLGALQVSPSCSGCSNSTFFASEAGLGAFIKLWENGDATRSLMLRPDFKVRFDRPFQQPSYFDYLYTLGVVFTFGAPPPSPAAAAPPPPPPAAAPPPPPPPPPPAPVPQDVVLEGVNFETNSAVLTADSKPVLDQVAQGLREHSGMRVEVQGHTDSTGTPAYNLKLSERRANAVRDYLISQGVAATQLSAKGYGQTQPVASNATAAGRASNRRVVMHVIDKPGDVTVTKEGQAQQ